MTYHPVPCDEAWLAQCSFAQEHHTRVTLRRHIPGALAVLAGEVDAATEEDAKLGSKKSV